MVKWIVWNGTALDIETVYLCHTELFEMEPSFDIKTVYLC